jgi:hypothetical protein
MKDENVKAKTFKRTFQLEISMYALVKLALRGVTDFTGLKNLESELMQAKIGSRKAVEIDGITIIGERLEGAKGVIVTGWDANNNNADVTNTARQLMETLYKVIFQGGLNAYDIKKKKDNDHDTGYDWANVVEPAGTKQAIANER